MTPELIAKDPSASLKTPADVLAAIPFIVGYHPSDSVVVLAMRGKQLAFTARGDLPAFDESERDLMERVEQLAETVLHQRPSAVLIVAYGSARRVDRFVPPLHDLFDEAGVRVLEAMRAEDGRYWSAMCGDPRCCPPEGTPFAVDTSVIAAEWTLAGRVARPDRESYESQLRPVGGLHRVSMRQATSRADERLLHLFAELDPALADQTGGCVTAGMARAAEAGMLEAALVALDGAAERYRANETPTDDEVAWITVLLVSIDVRDEAWKRIVTRREDLDLHFRMWLDIMRRAEPDLAPGPASLFGFAAWRDGQASLARLAFERALAEDPDYTMAQLLHHGLVHGLPPSALDRLGEPLTRPRARARRRRSSPRRARSRRG